jgi:hypothetical protein
VEEDKEINEIMSRPVFSIAEINVKIEDISTKTTEIKNMYLEYLNIQINIWNQMDMFYAQHYNFYPDCRVTYTNVWYQAYELMEQGRLFGVNNQSFNAWFGNFNAAFMNVYNVNYTDVREAHKAYIVLLNHARSYEEYLRESNSGQFMDSLKSGFSSMWVKSYMDEYNYITNMGTLPLPRDTEADINQLISSHDMQLNNINTRLHSYDDLFGRMNSPLYSTDEVLNISHLLIPTQVVTRETTTAVFNSALKFVRLT